ISPASTSSLSTRSPSLGFPTLRGVIPVALFAARSSTSTPRSGRWTPTRLDSAKSTSTELAASRTARAMSPGKTSPAGGPSGRVRRRGQPGPVAEQRIGVREGLLSRPRAERYEPGLAEKRATVRTLEFLRNPHHREQEANRLVRHRREVADEVENLPGLRSVAALEQAVEFVDTQQEPHPRSTGAKLRDLAGESRHRALGRVLVPRYAWTVLDHPVIDAVQDLAHELLARECVGQPDH